MGGAESLVPSPLLSALEMLVVRRNWFSTTMEDTDMSSDFTPPPCICRNLSKTRRGASRSWPCFQPISLRRDCRWKPAPIFRSHHGSSALPFSVWAIVAHVLCVNRVWTRAEKHITEKATKNAYAEENRDRVGH